jgi:hypothetical protein
MLTHPFSNSIYSLAFVVSRICLLLSYGGVLDITAGRCHRATAVVLICFVACFRILIKTINRNI